MNIELNIWPILQSALPSVWTFVSVLWPVGALFLATFLLKFLFEIWLPSVASTWRTKRRFREGARWRTDQDVLRWLRGMKPDEFEVYVADLFARLGYSTRVVGRSHDGGVDVEIEKNGVISYIQCKKYMAQQVSVGAVRDFYGALADHLAGGKGYFVTTSKFTLEAEKFAEDKPIELIDGFRLVEYIHLADREIATTTPKEGVGELCPRCQALLVERAGKHGPFLGCSAYPKCTYTRSR